MEYGKAFTFLTEDEKWMTKLLIGGVLAFGGGLILPLFLLYGYSFELLQNVATGSAQPAPEWDQLEEKFKRGLHLFAIRIVYFLPLILTLCCFVVLVIGLSASAGSASRDSANSAGGILGILNICFICFIFVYVIAATIVSDAATLIYASTGQLSDAFKFRSAFSLAQRHIADLAIVFLLTAAAGSVGAFASLITCGLGAPFVTAWVDFAKSHLLGQIFRKTGLALPPAVPASPPFIPPAPMTPAAPAA
jgi:uncharacterized membrane protein YjgN (DUF898 family)